MSDDQKTSYLVKSKKGHTAGVFSTREKAERFANHMNKLSGPQAAFIIEPIRNEPSIAKNFTITREDAELITKSFAYYTSHNRPELIGTLQKWLDELAADEAKEATAMSESTND